MLALLLLLVVQPAWAEPARHSDEISEATSSAERAKPSSKIDLLLTEQLALSSRVAALETAAAAPRQSNDIWFSIGIALLGAVALIHALRLRRLK